MTCLITYLTVIALLSNMLHNAILFKERYLSVFIVCLNQQ